MIEKYYTIYGKDNCPQCVKAENVLKAKGLPYMKLTYLKDYSLDNLEEVAGEPVRMLPYITCLDGNHLERIGSVDNLVKSLMH